MKLGSISSALENPFHEITWITSNYQAKSGDCRVANSFYVFRLRAKFRKVDPATGVIDFLRFFAIYCDLLRFVAIFFSEIRLDTGKTVKIYSLHDFPFR